MIARCRYSKGSSIPLDERYDLEYGLETDDHDYSSCISIGEIYFVFGIIFRKRRVELLICRTGMSPSWWPKSFFDLIDNIIPSDWGICFPKYNELYRPLYDNHEIYAMIGYKMLVNDPKHYDAILQSDDEGLVKFFQEMMRYENDSQENKFSHNKNL